MRVEGQEVFNAEGWEAIDTTDCCDRRGGCGNWFEVKISENKKITAKVCMENPPIYYLYELDGDDEYEYRITSADVKKYLNDRN